MTEQEFWNLIEKVDKESLDQGDEDSALLPLFGFLKGKAESELQEFEEILSQKLYAIDGQQYADNAGQSGPSGDGFLYARCYVVAKGKDYYERVLNQPEEMPKSLEQWCEGLLYLHHQAWSEITGKDEYDWDFEPTVSYETGSNEELWPDDAA